MFLAKKISIIICYIISGFVVAHAENHDFEYRIFFKVGESALDPNYSDNAATIAAIDSQLAQIAADTTLKISAISFNGTASPEGARDLNKQLAIERADLIENYIRSRITLPEDCKITRYTPGVAWTQLYDMVEASDMPNKAEVLAIIRDVPEFIFDEQGTLVDSRRKRLMDLRGGRPWNYMDEHFFPSLRVASSEMFTITTTVVSSESEPQAAEAAVVAPVVVEEAVVVTAVEEETVADTIAVEKKPFYMDLRSNMLYDALLLPNIGVEFYLGKNITVGANWTYGWWDRDHLHRYWRAYGGELNARYWFGSAAHEKPLTGHHIGVYGAAFIYDFEFGGKGQMGGEPGRPLWYNSSYMGGVEYGYSLPISRHFNIDFTIGVGYLGGKYFEYYPIDDHYVWHQTKRRNWVGPTKAEVSLVWLIGRGNYNARKGGKK